MQQTLSGDKIRPTAPIAGIIGLAFLFATSTSLGTTPITQAAAQEFEQALALTPDLEHGRQLYLSCVACHGPEAWGTPSGAYPQIAGQLKDVIIKQLADIRAGNRDNPIMRAFTSPRVLSTPQDIADVAAYIASLPMNPEYGQGPTHYFAEGKALYKENCVECHGEQGEGNHEDHSPKIHGQHYSYLVRQFEWIRNGRRRNSDPEMVKQIQRFSPKDVTAVMTYTSHIPVPPEKLAPQGWQNPDFPHYARTWRPAGR